MLKVKRIILSLCCFICIMLINNVKVLAYESVERMAGSDRYQTSIKILQNNWQQSDYIVLASGENFPDALCAAPLAQKYNAPVLLVEKNSISDSAIGEINRLGVKNAFIIGGTGVISENIEGQLINLNISYTRIQGIDRYETSVKVAELIGTTNGAVITSGENFPDALSIAPIAGKRQMPILLSTAHSLPEKVSQFIGSNIASQYYVVGGSGVISDSVLSGLINYKRLSGSNRYETNLAVINEFLDTVSTNEIYIATGEAFPDALSGSAAAAKTNSLIVLTNNIDCTAQSIIQVHLANISTVKVLGGTSRVSEGLLDKVLNRVKTSKLVLGYATYYYSGDNSSYNSLEGNSDLISEIATDTFTTDGYGNIKGVVPENQISYANNKNIKTFAMITNNFDGSITKALLGSYVNRTNLINNILAALKANNYKGVNIDLEGIYYSDRDYYTTFVRELYNRLHPEGFLVTAALPAKTRDVINETWTWAFDYSEVSKYLDQVVLMTYDEHYFGGTAGPIASIGWVQKVINYAVTVIPKEKILLGIAGYGYDWSSSGSKAYGVGQAYNIASQYGASVKWDSTSQSPYFYYVDSKAVQHSVWFENSTSIAYKLDIVNNEGLLGVALWRLGLENSDYWTTIKNKFGY